MKASKYDKLDYILESYINGNISQAKDLIKKYGKKNFKNDFYPYLTTLYADSKALEFDHKINQLL